MTAVSILGVPHDGNSSFLSGTSEAPALIRRELHCDAYSSWSETGIDLGVPGRLLDHGDIDFADGGDPWDRIDAHPDLYDAYQGNRRSHTSPSPSTHSTPPARSASRTGAEPVSTPRSQP